MPTVLLLKLMTASLKISKYMKSKHSRARVARSNEYAIAQEYINYRTKRDFERSQATDINFTINKLVNKDQAVVHENANKDSDLYNTQRDLTAGIVGKSIGLKMLPSHVANAHQKGDIHFHDLDYSPYTPMTNCCLIELQRS